VALVAFGRSDGAVRFTPGFHIVVNALSVLLFLSGALIGKSNLALSLSVFSLVLANAAK